MARPPARASRASSRPATIADLDAVVATLVESHRDYVWEAWAVPEPGRDAKLGRIYRTDLELAALPGGGVWVLDDGAAVAVWQRPDPAPLDADAQAQLDRLAGDVLGDRGALVREVEEIIGAHRPAEPHWYLGTMGTRSSRRREGCGTAVLRPVLEQLDATGGLAYLETSAPENVEFYARLGFEGVAVLEDLPHGAPDTWCMHRIPRTLAA